MFLPATGDILRTRYTTSQFGHFTSTTFWWQVIQWHPAVQIDAWCRQVAARYMLALFDWVNEDHLITCCHFKNLTHNDQILELIMNVAGSAFGPHSPACEATVYVTRHGVDHFGIGRGSSFPISCLSVEQTAGRADGDGQPPMMNDFLTAVQEFTPAFNARWVGGFISTVDGSFVRSTKSFTNPVIVLRKNRNRKALIPLRSLGDL